MDVSGILSYDPAISDFLNTPITLPGYVWPEIYALDTAGAPLDPDGDGEVGGVTDTDGIVVNPPKVVR